jgi:hypothetical protein
MNAATNGLTEKVDRLLLVLQKDIKHVQYGIEKLDKLRELLIRRDDVGLGQLLEEMRLQSQEYIENQKLRGELRQQIAAILGWPAEQVRLGRLQEVVPVEQGIFVRQMRRQLKEVISRLKNEYTGTVVLLADLARFNSMLLGAILGTGQSRNITYDAHGGASRSGEVAFVNLQF